MYAESFCRENNNKFRKKKPESRIIYCVPVQYYYYYYTDCTRGIPILFVFYWPSVSWKAFRKLVPRLTLYNTLRIYAYIYIYMFWPDGNLYLLLAVDRPGKFCVGLFFFLLRHILLLLLHVVRIITHLCIYARIYYVRRRGFFFFFSTRRVFTSSRCVKSVLYSPPPNHGRAATKYRKMLREERKNK